MYYKLVVSKKWVPKGFSGISLYPFIIVSSFEQIGSTTLLNHEKIHLRQQMELFIVFFYIWYLFEFLIKWLRMGSKYQAYRAISFEREAYVNEKNLNYNSSKTLFSFLKYL